MVNLSLRALTRPSLVMVAMVIVTGTGCGEGRPPIYPVQGSVRFEDGQPVPIGVVEFRSQPDGRIAKGKIDQNGQFRLSTFDDGDGAVAGEHRVVVIQHFDSKLWSNKKSSARADPLEHEQHRHEVRLVHRRYADYKTSDLTAVVKPQANNQIELNVGKPAPAPASGKSAQ